MWYLGVTHSTSPWTPKVGYSEGLNSAPNTPSLSSPSNDVWTTNNKPTFGWSFSDPNSYDTQTAYQLQLDNSNDFSSLDFDSGKVASSSSSYTPVSAFSDGIWYWRVKVWDTDDDSSSWSTYRIVKIDTLAPSNPSTLASTSHTAGVWSNDRTIDVSFGGALDSGSGVYGYSVTWDYSDSTLPDTTRDYSASTSSLTSSSMSDSATVYFHIRTLDYAGNIAASASHLGPFCIDYTPPTNPTATSPTHAINTWTNQTVCQVNWSGANGSLSGINGYSVIWDKNAGTTPDTAKEFNADGCATTSPGLADGAWYFHIRTRDEAGNWAAAASHFGPLLIDSSAPLNPMNLQSTSHLKSRWFSDSTIDVAWTGGTDGSVSGVSGYSYLWDDEPVTIPDDVKECDHPAASATSPPLPDGAYNWFHLRTRDNAGNWNPGAVHLGPFWTDSSPPENPVALASTDHRPNEWSSDNKIEVTWSLPELGGQLSGYDGFSISWDLSDSTLPDNSVELSADQTTTTSPPVQDGNNIWFHIRAKDRAGNWAATAAHLGPFWIDTTPPENPKAVSSQSHSFNAWSNDNTIDIAWSGAYDVVSGVAGYAYTWDQSPSSLPLTFPNATALTAGTTSPALADGKYYYIHLRTQDRAGNRAPGAVHLGPFHIDTRPPALQHLWINHQAAVSRLSLVSVELSAEDPAPASGLDAMSLAIDGGSWAPWEPYNASRQINLTGPDGLRTVRLLLRDRANNTAAESSASILLDTLPPENFTLAIDGGAPYSSSRNVTLTISADDLAPGSGLESMALSQDGANWLAWEPFCSTRAFTLPPPDGPARVFMRLRDVAGNVGPLAGAGIFIDTMAPTGLAITLAGGANLTSSLEIPYGLSATDPGPSSGLSEMAFSQDGNTWDGWLPFDASAVYSLSPGDGCRTLHVKVRDRAQNEAGPASDCILIDTGAPVIGTVVISGVTRQSAVVTWYSSEPSVGMLDYGTDDGYGTRLWDREPAPMHSLTLTGLAEGTEYHVRALGIDLLGNGPAASPDRTFTTTAGKDRLRPVVSEVQVVTVTDRTAIVNWETDEPADSLVEYGLTRQLGSVESDHGFGLAHTVVLRGLLPGQKYYFRARSSDLAGNGPASGPELSFTTMAQPESGRPGIYDVKVAKLTDTVAVITWTTSRHAIGAVDYGTGLPYSYTARSDGLLRSHAAVVSGLPPSTVIHYRIRAQDSDGNVGTTPVDLVFSTGSAADTQPPVINAPRVVSIGRDNVTIALSTDEPANLFVDFGPNVTYGSSVSSTEFSTLRQLTLRGLSPGRTYHYRVSAVDASGNGPSSGPDLTFTTKAAPAAAAKGFGLGEEGSFMILALAALALGGLAGRHRAGGPMRRRRYP
jgi:hypothetical protein